ncbi:aspartate carbamoyltransferase catalytic subunit [Campylobacter pinnipediorum]|uniref:Aspartate carbamoyltransferase n=1 Tax=Campylobacter pinnipediorum subsp. pinnipediorum TaxID=1660067 RepID=A0AAX0LCR3_9BACT|nr:aspartate carbamoyltransferase catalytic subunit [Campylobacter pinnipediorum]AQW81447.1 aspartate carbamoyltransferase, catalytic subunit [Campylobacter pinnipediorum subsp. pinnipediorum]AQW83075.1 aspartate carbamoyltransferase, catalytic subunit [Campylobacter pinnipediorum subsp. pinnipediorum]AQW84643.1 aspartate carbamoyltransferase, catalytic subunit [Campylobacter pinnipediorum subsp. pinnipediorum]OPA78285.1 aspartate carbamoyltransferase [Campylobacter pinnipediorum subsp. pinnipe
MYSYKRKDLLGTIDLSKEEILYFLDKAKEFKQLNLQDIKKSDSLRGKTTINAFFENSTRTRTSFEIAAKRLGADAVNFTASSSSVKKGETLIDTIKNMAAMKTDIIVIRHYSSGAAILAANNTEASIVNAGDGLNEHPSQSLLDLFTISEYNKKLDKSTTVAIIGDIARSRVARSNIWAMKTLGINVKLFAPAMMMPKDAEVFGCQICKNMEEACEGSDVIIMLRIQLERSDGDVAFPSSREYSKFFGLNKDRAKLANKNAIILHPGPINRGVEINSDVADSDCSVILNQVENGVAIRMAILHTLAQNRN